MIKEQLLQKTDYIIIKYDAWENSFYSDPLIAILSCVIDEIIDRYDIPCLKENINNAAMALVDIGSKISPSLNKLIAVVKGLLNTIATFQQPINTANLNEFKSYKKLLTETKELLNKLTSSEDGKNQTKLIILVDEIDRCLPDEQLKILERLHHLFDIKNSVVIVAMNQYSVTETVKTSYGVDGCEYLHKFFDFTFKLNSSTNVYFQNLLNNFVNALGKIGLSNDQMELPATLAYQSLACGNKKALDKADNRELTRYYNALINVCNDFGSEKLRNPYYIFFILVALYIRRIIAPSFLDM